MDKSIIEILEAMNLSFPLSDIEVSPFTSAEDGSEYSVWLVRFGDQKFVLKKAKGFEIETYSAFFSDIASGAPRFYASVNYQGDDYFLMEYVEGVDLCKCTREGLKKAIDAIISLQNKYWEDKTYEHCGFSFEKSLVGRISRGEYIFDDEIEAEYACFLEEYRRLPRTLCHDDLLPFNVLVSDNGATLIDWEYGGILPYPTPIARLIAHCEANETAFFYMSDDDKTFAIDYYYESFVCSKGISYPEYRRSLELFVLYEYCEWIMLGNKYKSEDRSMLEKYTKWAKDLINK